MADLEALTAELRDAVARFEGRSNGLNAMVHQVEKDLVSVKTLLRVQATIGAVLVVFLGWLGSSLYNLNGTVSELKPAMTSLTSSVEGLQTDLRGFRTSLDAHLVLHPPATRQR